MLSTLGYKMLHIPIKYKISFFNQKNYLEHMVVGSFKFSKRNGSSSKYIEDSRKKWWKKIRVYLYPLLLKATQMGGNGNRVQIDESLFRGRRKYNRGPFKSGYQKYKQTVRDKFLA